MKEPNRELTITPVLSLSLSHTTYPVLHSRCVDVSDRIRYVTYCGPVRNDEAIDDDRDNDNAGMK